MNYYFNNYSEVKKAIPDGLRGTLRKYTLNGLSVLNKVKNIESYLNKPRIQFIYIHHIFQDEEANFEQLLQKLSINHEFLSYSESVNKILTGTIDRPYICFSSDDGFKNNLRAAEILNRYNAKACFFVNPFVVESQSFETIRHYCKNRLHFPPVEFMNWKDIETMQKMGHEIGSHTFNHINVAQTARDIFVEDCQNTLAILNRQCGDTKHFAFPYGRFIHFNEMGRKAVFEAGFQSCASAERGCHINHHQALNIDELCIRRDHLILDWDIDHILYFLIKSSQKACSSNNLFTYHRQHHPNK